MAIARIRWGDNDHYFGPFTYARDRSWRPLGIVLGSGVLPRHGDKLRAVVMARAWIRAGEAAVLMTTELPPHPDSLVADVAARIRICGGRQGYLELCVPRGMTARDVESGIVAKVPSTSRGWKLRKVSPRDCSHGEPSRYHCIVEAQ